MTVDSALSEPDGAGAPEHGGASAEPAAGAEHRLEVVLRVFSDILGHEVASTDDFFAVGGHSALVIELIATLRKQHHLKVPARQFLTDATPQAVAAVAQQLPEAGNG